MKRVIIAIAALTCFSATGYAQKIYDVAVSDFNIVKDGTDMNIDMIIDLSSLDVKNRRSVHLLPVLKNGADSIVLSPIGIYSRGRYINYLRKGKSIFEDLNEEIYREGKQPDMFRYSTQIHYEPWMDGSEIFLNRVTCGCCQDLLSEEQARIGGFSIPVFEPDFIYVRPEAELLKTREISGTAFIDFPVSKTDINPDYRNNRSELAKIIATVDSVRNDSDIKVRQLYFKGFASPESPYSNNERLAKGRTASLKKYVQDLYHFPEEMIVAESEPENWEGLRIYVANSSLEHKDEILDVIDGNRKPDDKEWIIKSDFPKDYRFLLDNCYPGLRKTDYKIEYTIQDFTDINKILEIFKTSPNKLSLNELYIASTAFEPGSEEFIEIFETAVRMYPGDPVANLNAANVAISDERYKDAKAYLKKAGETPEADYAWGLYYLALGDYDKADERLKKAREDGIAEAAEMIRQGEKLREYYTNNK